MTAFSFLTRGRGGTAVTPFGKLPDSPEFIAPPAHGPPLAAFEAWLEGGMGCAKVEAGSAWEAAFTEGAVYGFLWPTEGAPWVVGVLAPSHDSAGRLFPAGLRLLAPALPGEAHLVPAVFGDFLSDAYEALADAVRNGGAAALEARASALALPTATELVAGRDDYAAWCAEATLTQAWSVVFPEHGQEQALVTLGALLRCARGPRRAPTLRLPLGRGGAVSAVWWLDTLRRIGATPAPRPCFWSVQAEALVVLLDGPAPQALQALWPPRVLPAATVSDLVGLAGVGEGTAPSIPSAVLEVWSKPDGNVAALLAALGR